MENRIAAEKFIKYYGDQLVPIFEMWAMERKFNEEQADRIFTEVCRGIYGVRADGD